VGGGVVAGDAVLVRPFPAGVGRVADDDGVVDPGRVERRGLHQAVAGDVVALPNRRLLELALVGAAGDGGGGARGQEEAALAQLGEELARPGGEADLGGGGRAAALEQGPAEGPGPQLGPERAVPGDVAPRAVRELQPLPGRGHGRPSLEVGGLAAQDGDGRVGRGQGLEVEQDLQLARRQGLAGVGGGEPGHHPRRAERHPTHQAPLALERGGDLAEVEPAQPDGGLELGPRRPGLHGLEHAVGGRLRLVGQGLGAVAPDGDLVDDDLVGPAGVDEGLQAPAGGVGAVAGGRHLGVDFLEGEALAAGFVVPAEVAGDGVDGALLVAAAGGAVALDGIGAVVHGELHR
jgi:hypothetical protein